MLMRTSASLVFFVAVGIRVFAAQGDTSEFIVLRTDRVVTWTATGESAHLDCSILGTGDTSQIHCNSQTFGSGISRVYHVALVVGSNRVGYVISCGGGLLRRIGCKPLTAGQVLKGTVKGDQLSVVVEGTKNKHYRVETSAYIGPGNRENTMDQSATSLTGSRAVSEDQAFSPTLRSAAQAERSKDSIQQPPISVSPEPGKAAARVNITSTPSGAEIYIDGKFFGNTPSEIGITAGEHIVRIDLGSRSWSRSIEITSGEINLNADLSADK